LSECSNHLDISVKQTFISTKAAFLNQNTKRMKKQALTLSAVLLVFLFLGACGSENTSEQSDEEMVNLVEEAVPEVQDPLLTLDLNSVEAIDDWLELTTMKAHAGGMTEMEPKVVSRGDMTYYAVVRDLKSVQMVQARSPSWTDLEQGFRYFLRDGEVSALEEVKKLEDGSYQINTFYYDDGSVLKGTSRSGATAKAAQESTELSDYESPYGDLDFRLKYQEVKTAADKFITDIKGG